MITENEIIDFFEYNRNQEELSVNEIEFLDSLSIEQIESALKVIKNLGNRFDAIQMGLKLILNSIYGSFGNQHFVCSNKDIAESITIMGQLLIKYMDEINEKYWYDYWNTDTEMHDILGIDTNQVKKIDNSYIHRDTKTEWTDEVTQQLIDDGVVERKVPVSVYIDTDSTFVSFQPSMDSCNWQNDEFDFIMKISKNRLEPLFKVKLNGLAKKYGVKNLQDFEMENISESVLFVTKKKYIKHVIWEDGRTYKRLSNIIPKGVELIQRGTPKFAREKILEIITYIFDNYKTYNIKDLLKFVRNLRKEFELADINDITKSTSVSYYWSSKEMVEGVIIDGKGIVNDKDDLVYGKGTYYMVKAAGLHNHLLNQHKELHEIHEFIKPGSKVRYYPCIHEKNDVFAYNWGKYPHEYAPPVDYDEQFLKTVTNTVNYYIEPLGLPALNKRLSIVMSLF